MKRMVYCCDASRDLYEEYYARQNGGKIPVFAGSRFQSGHGFGSILCGFFRRLVLPFFKTNAKGMWANAVKTGLEVAGLHRVRPHALGIGLEEREHQSSKETAQNTSETVSALKSRARENGNFSAVLSGIVLLVQVATGVAAIDPALHVEFGRQMTSAVSVQDVLEGQSFKESAKKRVPAGIKRTVKNINWQSGSGVKRRRRVKRVVRRTRDIFS